MMTIGFAGMDGGKTPFTGFPIAFAFIILFGFSMKSVFHYFGYVTSAPAPSCLTVPPGVLAGKGWDPTS